ncbi:MAG: peptidylprolyl isomerase [Desulfatibacillum sp.]|nr:peptidylprolyl isomerase [Desulfatibacillum sp.]
MPGGVIRYGLIAAIVVIIALLFIPCPSLAQADKILARVNGVDILQWQIDLTEGLMFGNQNGVIQSHSQILQDEILRNAIDAEIVCQDAQKRGLVADERGVQKLLWDYMASYPTLSAYEEAMAAMGVTEQGFESLARKVVIVGACLHERFGQDLIINEDEAMDFYKKNPRKFNLPRAVRVRHVLVKFSPDQDVTREKALSRAREIIARLTSGEPFSTVARETSDGPEKNQGGDLGYISRGGLENTELAPLESMILDLVPGTIGPVTETNIGFHIVTALDIRPESITPFESIKDKLIATLHKKRFIEALNTLAAELKPEYEVKVLENP